MSARAKRSRPPEYRREEKNARPPTKKNIMFLLFQTKTKNTNLSNNYYIGIKYS